MPEHAAEIVKLKFERIQESYDLMKPQSLFDWIEEVVRILSTGQGMPNYLAYHAKQAAEEAQGMYDLGHYASVIHQVGGTAFYNTSDALEIIQNAAREKAPRIQQGLPY